MEPVSSDQLALWVEEARAQWSIPGLVVGVRRNGEDVFAAAGVRELGRDEPVRPETVFRVASITKPFTATLAMTLVQDGLLDLDEPPPGSRVAATVRQLLSHQGGLANEWPTPLDELGEDDEALLRLGEGDPEPLPVGPGELYSYSNAGYWLAGAAAGRVCGSSFEEAMATRARPGLPVRAGLVHRRHARTARSRAYGVGRGLPVAAAPLPRRGDCRRRARELEPRQRRDRGRPAGARARSSRAPRRPAAGRAARRLRGPLPRPVRRARVHAGGRDAPRRAAPLLPVRGGMGEVPVSPRPPDRRARVRDRRRRVAGRT